MTADPSPADLSPTTVSLEDLSSAREPTTADLHALERLGRRRVAIEAVQPANEDQRRVHAHLLAIVDGMEESLCEEGRHAAIVDHGWQTLDALEPRLHDGQARDPTPARHRRRRRHRRAARRAPRPPGDRTTAPEATRKPTQEARS